MSNSLKNIDYVLEIGLEEDKITISFNKQVSKKISNRTRLKLSSRTDIGLLVYCLVFYFKALKHTRHINIS